jgi:hypothetical protein
VLAGSRWPHIARGGIDITKPQIPSMIENFINVLEGMEIE